MNITSSGSKAWISVRAKKMIVFFLFFAPVLIINAKNALLPHGF